MFFPSSYDDLRAIVKDIIEHLRIADFSPSDPTRPEECLLDGYIPREGVDARIENIPRDLDGNLQRVPLAIPIRT